MDTRNYKQKIQARADRLKKIADEGHNSLNYHYSIVPEGGAFVVYKIEKATAIGYGNTKEEAEQVLADYKNKNTVQAKRVASVRKATDYANGKEIQWEERNATPQEEEVIRGLKSLVELIPSASIKIQVDPDDIKARDTLRAISRGTDEDAKLKGKIDIISNIYG